MWNPSRRQGQGPNYERSFWREGNTSLSHHSEEVTLQRTLAEAFESNWVLLWPRAMWSLKARCPREWRDWIIHKISGAMRQRELEWNLVFFSSLQAVLKPLVHSTTTTSQDWMFRCRCPGAGPYVLNPPSNPAKKESLLSPLVLSFKELHG